MSPLFKFSKAIADESNLPRIDEKGIIVYKDTILIMEVEKKNVLCFCLFPMHKFLIYMFKFLFFLAYRISHTHTHTQKAQDYFLSQKIYFTSNKKETSLVESGMAMLLLIPTS